MNKRNQLFRNIYEKKKKLLESENSKKNVCKSKPINEIINEETESKNVDDKKTMNVERLSPTIKSQEISTNNESLPGKLPKDVDVENSTTKGQIENSNMKNCSLT